MTHLRWKILIDLLLAITFLSLMITGIWPDMTHKYVGKTGFHLLHVQAGELFIVLGLAHVALNWRWVHKHIFRLKNKAKP